MRSIRDDDVSMFRCSAFVNNGTVMALGSQNCELKLVDISSGEVEDVMDAHSGAVYMLRVRIGARCYMFMRKLYCLLGLLQ